MRFQTTLAWLAAALMIFSLSACSSTRYASTLKPSGDSAFHMDDLRFSIISLDGRDDSLAQRSRELYPNLFTDEWTGLPVVVKTDSRHESTRDRAAFLTGFCTLGIIPFPGTEKTAYDVRASLINSMGESVPAGKVTYEFENVMWMTILGPLGLLPVAGVADLPRDYQCLFISSNESFGKSAGKGGDYQTSCHVEAVVKSLQDADQARLAEEYRLRKARLQEVTINGRRYWSYLGPVLSQKPDKAESFAALIYADNPRRSTNPLDRVTVARRDETGAWHPVTGYLRSMKTLTAASVLMENGVPSKVVVRAVGEPPLEDFIDIQEMTAAGMRWSNGVLLDAKNISLAKILNEKSGDELLALATRIEKAILDLSEQAERAKDRAQAIVEKGQGDPAPDRELSVLFRQRIEILKPILAAVKQGAAAKQ